MQKKEVQSGYRIKDWERHFEVAQSRRRPDQRFSWVAMPNKHDGKGYRRMTRDRNAERLFCAWCLIAEVASKSPDRGTLRDSDGWLTPEDMADKTGFRPELFKLAFQWFSRPEIGWLEVVEDPVNIEQSPPEIFGQDRNGQPKSTEVDRGQATLQTLQTLQTDSTAQASKAAPGPVNNFSPEEGKIIEDSLKLCLESEGLKTMTATAMKPIVQTFKGPDFLDVVREACLKSGVSKPRDAGAWLFGFFDKVRNPKAMTMFELKTKLDATEKEFKRLCNDPQKNRDAIREARQRIRETEIRIQRFGERGAK